MSTIIYVTENGYTKLQEKAKEFYAERDTILEEMKNAMEQGGELSENSEYLVAKESLDRVEKRMQEVQIKLQNSKIIYKENIPDDDVVRFGKTVSLRDVDTEELFEYTIVGEDESDLKINKISHLSPIGKALLNQKMVNTSILKLQKEIEN